METAQDRLKFAVEFAEKDLRTLRPGDLLNMRDDLMAFLLGTSTIKEKGGILAMPLKPPFPQDYEVEDFEQLQLEHILN